jgi:hypothetical protein
MLRHPLSGYKSALARDTPSSRVTYRHIRVRQPALYRHAAVNGGFAGAAATE